MQCIVDVVGFKERVRSISVALFQGYTGQRAKNHPVRHVRVYACAYAARREPTARATALALVR